jgi:hypothetical protein
VVIKAMKTGMSLEELSEEVERRAGAMQDFLVPVEKLEAVVVSTARGRVVRLAVRNWWKKTFRLTQQVHTQLARYLGISQREYWKMLVSAPEAFAGEVNRLFKEKATDTRTLRTMDGAVFGFLGESDRGLGNEDVAAAVLPVLKARDLRVMSCAVTNGWLYIKAVDRSIERDVPTGRRLGDGSHVLFDTISPGIVVRNSEVEENSFAIEPSIWTHACTNLAITGRTVRKYDVDALLGGKTRKPAAAEIRNRISALVTRSLDEADLEAEARRLKLAAEDRIEMSDAIEIVARAGEGVALTAGERRSVLERFIAGEDFTRYGLQAAITRASADVEDYDRATELERLGGRVIALPSSGWKTLLNRLPHVPRVTLRAVS